MLNRSSLTVAATLALAAAASAQVGTLYTFTQAVGSYTPITGGTLIGTATTVDTLDDATYAVTLPFTFTFDSVPQTQVQIQTNGHLAFGGTSPGTTYTPISSTIAVPGFVSACGRDLMGGYQFLGTRTLGSDQVTAVSVNGPLSVGDVLVGTGVPAGTTITAIVGNTLTMSAVATATNSTASMQAFGPWSEMRWEVQGTTPNQVFIAQWSNFRRFSSSLTTCNGTYLNFQIRLHEGGAIECVYGDCSPGVGVTTTVLHQVGLRGATNTFPVDVNNRLSTKGTNDWDTSVAGTGNASGQVFNSVAPANVISNGLTYMWAPQVGTPATNDTIGAGCGAIYDSFYELFATSALAGPALSGNALVLTPTGTGYTGAWAPGAAAALFVTPVTPTPLATGDDGSAVYTFVGSPLPTPYGAQTAINVSGNAIIGFGSGALTYPGTNAYTPTPDGFLNSTTGGVYAWHDYNQSEAGSGAITAEEIGTVTYVTFLNVESYSTPTVANPSTLQFQLDSATGNITICFVSIDTDTTSTFGSGHLVGVTAPGASGNPGSVNLATATLASTTGVAPLELVSVTRPILGTSWNLTTNNVPAPGLTLEILGFADPGILDLSFIGMPGCELHSTLDYIGGPGVGVGSVARSLSIPLDVSLIGAEIYAQSASAAPGINAFNLITSNGIKGTLGDI